MSVLASITVFAAEFEAPNKILPETKEIVFGGLAFLIVLFILWKYAWPAIVTMMKDRTSRIQRQLDEAERAQSDAKAQAADIRARKGDIEAERARILAEADDSATRLLAEGRTRLEEEVAELHARADADIASSTSRMSSELQAEVGALAAGAAEKVVTEQLDEATVQRLVEEFIAHVGRGEDGDK